MTDLSATRLAERLTGDGPVLLFGGTFDPPHRAHIELPLRARAALGAAWLVYIPAAQSPHKTETPGASGDDRVAMLEAAIEGERGVLVSRIELDAQGGPSYTVRTLERLREEIGSEREIRLLIGADQAVSFHRWREFSRILELAEPLVMLRSPEETRASLREAMAPNWAADELESWATRVVDVPVVDASATRVRELLDSSGVENSELCSLLPAGVIGVIRERGLYGSAASGA